MNDEQSDSDSADTEEPSSLTDAELEDLFRRIRFPAREPMPYPYPIGLGARQHVPSSLYVGHVGGRNSSEVATLWKPMSGDVELNLYWCGDCGGYFLAFARSYSIARYFGMMAPPDPMGAFKGWTERWNRIAEAEGFQGCDCPRPPPWDPTRGEIPTPESLPTSEPSEPGPISRDEFRDLFGRFFPELVDDDDDDDDDD